MSNLEAPMRNDMTTLPAPTMDLLEDRAPLPPPDQRVPALPPPALPSLTGAPVVPPMPRLSLDEIDAQAEIDDTADACVRDDERLPTSPTIVESAPVMPGSQPVAARSVEDIIRSESPSTFDLTPADDGHDEAPALDNTTSEYPTVDAQLLSPANEPLGAPPQVAMVMPSLPSATGTVPSPSAEPPTHQPSQVGLPPVAAGVVDAPTPPAAKATSQASRGRGRSIVVMLMAMVLAVVAGAGAHLGSDWWQDRNSAEVAGIDVDGTDLASWPQVDPPAIKYTDTVTVFRNDGGTRTLTTHRELSSGHTQANVVATDAADTVVDQVDVDFRGEQSFVRSTPESPWALTPEADALGRIGETWTTEVFTVRDVFPAEAMPYITVLENVERVLPVRPLQAAANADGETAAPMAISTDPTSMVWQYRVILDVESFRVNDTVAFQEWQRRLGPNAVPRIEAWVDATGIVRQLAVETGGTVVTQTLVGGSADSARFETNPLLEPVAAETAAAPVAAPEVGE